MKQHLILKDCTGSQSGHDYHAFTAGTTAELSDDLARAFVAEGWAKPVAEAAGDIAKAPPALAEAVLEAVAEAEIQPRELAEGDLPEGSEAAPVNPAEIRETKVDGPEETKPARAKKGTK
jgi:hypothetical protein